MYVAWRGIALAIDYSLFMLTRYMEEVQSGASTEMSLKSMMRQSGHVVMISASVLIICYVSRMKDGRNNMVQLWVTCELPILGDYHYIINCMILYNNNNRGQPTVILRWKNLKAQTIGRTERIHWRPLRWVFYSIPVAASPPLAWEHHWPSSCVQRRTWCWRPAWSLHFQAVRKVSVSIS